MSDETTLLERVRSALRADTRIRFDQEPFVIAISNGCLVFEGDLAEVAVKRRALRRAASVAEGRGIVDRLHVRPAEPMADGMIRDLVRDALIEEPALARCRLTIWSKGAPDLVRDPPAASGSIEIRVAEGVVTLDGEVSGLQQKRLAGALAWWVPGSRDVINGMGVSPPEEDNDDEITDAVRLVLEKDPFVNPDQVRVTTKDASVTLDGMVATEAERDMAEHDAWYVFGVDDVANRLAVGRTAVPS
jgi:osmotically-inducible protein OsmY